MMSSRRWCAVAVTAAALVAPAQTASASPQKIVPVGPDPSWGCVQDTTPGLSVRTPRGELVTPTFRQAHRRLTGQVQAVARRLRGATSGTARRRLQRQARRLAATVSGVKRCRAGSLPAPAASRRSFAFVCLHGFVLPSVVVRGTCAIDLRPRGQPDKTKARAAAYDLGATYDTLDTVLHAECADDDGTFLGPQSMKDLFALYIVGCPPEETETPLPVSAAWDVLRMEVENCDEIMAADGGCPPPAPRPAGGGGSPTPRDPPAEPVPDCVILGMDVENPDC